MPDDPPTPGLLSERTSGILLHLTSLPGPYGMGDLGPDAGRFAGALDEMHQSWWQMLPVGPTGYGDSPYQSPSTFAGNPLLISPQLLVEDELTDAARLEDAPPFSATQVRYEQVIPWRREILAEVGEKFSSRAPASVTDAFDLFCAEHGPVWLDDFALYMALKRANGLRPWWEWDQELVRRSPEAIGRASRDLSGEVHSVKVEQFCFDWQFFRLRATCDDHGVGLIGDLPIFVAHDSADVWAHQDLFFLDERGQPTVVAGVPPDYFSETGQRWGNPLYRWDRHAEQGFGWWTERMRRALALFDLVRVDHFRGFAAYWEVPAEAETAEEGAWVEAPGEELFGHLERSLGELPLIAEDLGIITSDVDELRERFGFPGMRVLQFGFDPDSDHAPDRYPEHVVAYTGTHDNDTAVGWWEDQRPGREKERAFARQMLGLDDGDAVHWAMVEAVMESAANTAIIPLQDLLGVGSEGRMNRPGMEHRNWRWRFSWDQLDDRVRQRMRTLTERSGRG